MRVTTGLLLFVLGCSPISFRELRPDYDSADKKETIRIAIVTSPMPDGIQQVGDMWSEIAKHYASDHRDFIVKATRSAAREPADLCADGIDGILRLVPQITRVDTEVTVAAVALLTRCRDGVVVWSAAGKGTWSSADKGLVDVTEHYTTEYGATVTPYVAPSFRLLKSLLATLPLPSIQGNDAAVEEKIEAS